MKKKNSIALNKAVLKESRDGEKDYDVTFGNDPAVKESNDDLIG